MAREMIELHNTMGAPAKVWIVRDADKIDEYVIPPQMTFPFQPDVAEKFLREYPGSVVEFRLPNLPDIPGKSRKWIANGTGNPWLPTEIFIPGLKETDAPIRIPHPNREPLTLHWSVRRPEESIEIEEATEIFRPVAIQLSLPPFERLSVPSPVAEFIMQRDGLQLSEYRRGKVIYCREPQVFEPRRSWPLDDLIIYARLVDDVFFSKERLEKDFPPEEALKGNQLAISQVKQRLWQHLFFLIIDPKRGLPPEAAFEGAKRRVKMERQNPGSTAPAKRAV
jgi:hypothetical protein